MTEKLKQGSTVPFTQVANTILQTPDLSYKEKGLLGYLLSKPPDWVFHVNAIAAESQECKDTVLTILRSLIDKRYVTRTEKREQGMFSAVEYCVYQEPQDSDNVTINPDTPEGTSLSKSPQRTSSDTVKPPLQTKTSQTKKGGSCSLIPSSSNPPVESEGKPERTAVALQAAPDAKMRVDPEKEPEASKKTPGKNRLTYFNEIHEIATLFANCPPILDAAEKDQAVALAKKYKSSAVLNAWHAYLTKKPGKPFRFFVQDAEQEIKQYMPVKSTQDPEFLEALKHRELIQSCSDESQPILDGFFESIGGRLTSEGTREDTLRRNGLEDLKPKEASEVPAEETPTIIDAGVELVTA